MIKKKERKEKLKKYGRALIPTYTWNRVFSLTWPASMQIYWNKRKRLHKKRVQLPKDWFGTPTWPPWRHVKTLYRVFSLTWSASMQIYWNKRKRLHKKRVELPKDWFGIPTCPPFHCFGTPICRRDVMWKHSILFCPWVQSSCTGNSYMLRYSPRLIDFDTSARKDAIMHWSIWPWTKVCRDSEILLTWQSDLTTFPLYRGEGNAFN